MLQHTGLSYNDKISARNTILVTSDNNKLSPSYYKLQKNQQYHTMTKYQQVIQRTY